MQSTEIKVGKKNSPKISNFLVRCNWTEERDTIAVVIQQSDDAERKSHKKLKFNVILIKTLTKKLNSGKKSPKRISPGIVILFLFDDIFPHRVDCFNVLDIVAWLTIILWNAASPTTWKSRTWTMNWRQSRAILNHFTFLHPKNWIFSLCFYPLSVCISALCWATPCWQTNKSVLLRESGRPE